LIARASGWRRFSSPITTATTPAALRRCWRDSRAGARPCAGAIGGRTQALADGDVARVPALDLALDVIDVPHTAGHRVHRRRRRRAVAFVGDTLFGGGCGRLFEGTPAQMAHSLARLAELPGNTRVYCAHEYTLSNLRFARVVEPGNDALAARQAREQQRRDRGQPTVPMTLDDERATNPFLRAAVPAVAAAATAWAGRPLPDDVAVFAALREWKNGFR
jgi:hydroxyacylglutathione hydrolase